MRALVVVVAVALATVFGAGKASAQEARDLFLAGQSAYQQGNYEAAIDAWRRAYELDPRPALQYNLAQAYGRLGRAEEEQAALQRFVDAAPAAGTPEDDPQLTNARARLAAIEARVRRTGISLSGVPEGAEVRVDDEAQTTSSEWADPVQVEPGPHRVVVRLAGHHDFAASVVVRAGDVLLVPVQMMELPDTVVVEEGHSGMRLAAVLTMSLGGAGLAAGGTLGLLALKKADGEIEGTPEGDRAMGFALGSDIALYSGAALAATGLVLLIVDNHRDGDGDGAAAVGLSPLVGAGTVGLAVDGRF